MGIVEKEIWVGLGGSASLHFKQKGYEIPTKESKAGKFSIQRGTKILVKIEDLPIMSSIKVTKSCDECLKEIPLIPYSNIIISRLSTDGKDRCSNCAIAYRANSRKNNVEIEKSAEYYCINNDKEYLFNIFSSKNVKKLKEISYGSHFKFLWNCPVYGELHEHETILTDKIISDHKCPFCTNQKVLLGFNDMWTSNSEMARLLWNPEDGLKYTSKSSKKLDFKCPDCDSKIANRIISNIEKQGLSCPFCSDGVSYPEKFISGVLLQLNIDFETQKSFNWAKGKKYDFYINLLNCIIEAHGAQHYDRSFKIDTTGSVINEKENDKIKEKLSQDNGISHYIVIDCAISEMDYIKKNIISSKVTDLFNLKEINWLECHKYACNSLIKTTCDLWNNGIHNTLDIADIIKISRTTTIGYLKKGSILKFCDYDSNEEIKKGRTKNSGLYGMRKIVRLTTEGKYMDEFESMRIAMRQLNIGSKNIWQVCNGIHQTAGGFKWMYKENYIELFKGE